MPGNHDNGIDEFHYLAVIQLAFQQLAVIHLVLRLFERRERERGEVGTTLETLYVVKTWGSGKLTANF